MTAPAGSGAAHALTEYGTTNCPVEGVRANVDDGECSACGANVAGSGASPARDGDTAERIVATAVQIAQTSPMSLREATNALLEVGGVFAERDTAVAALERVRALHRPIRMAMIGGTDLTCSECRREAIHETDVTWPCSTAAALDASGPQ